MLLDILERHGARATFFVIGRQARHHPDILRRMVNAGHTIGNHTMDHPLFLAASSRERRRQIRAGAEAIAPYGLPLFRPPKGHQSVASRIDVLRTGHQVVTWNAHAEDWRLHDSDWMAEQLERQIAPGSIVLLHDAIWDPLAPGVEDRRPVIETVDQVLERMRGRFHFVTVPELLRHGPAVRQDWIYPKST
jgi:peptidoglycan/xylan/chitin deacetylase (PgdA/CDA1 family)